MRPSQQSPFPLRPWKVRNLFFHSKWIRILLFFFHALYFFDDTSQSTIAYSLLTRCIEPAEASVGQAVEEPAAAAASEPAPAAVEEEKPVEETVGVEESVAEEKKRKREEEAVVAEAAPAAEQEKEAEEESAEGNWFIFLSITPSISHCICLLTGNVVEAPKKRGRGRPPKKAKKEESESEAEVSEASEAEDDDAGVIDKSNIITSGRRTRGKKIDFAGMDTKSDEDEDDDEEEAVEEDDE
jgi:hypothetical protein